MATREGKALDKTSSLGRLIYQGATPTELATIFGVDRRDISSRLAGVPPTGSWDGIDIWSLKVAAPKLVSFDDQDADMIARILATHHHQLPKLLSKEYWMGQNHRLTFLQKTGELWDTQAVVALLGGVFKSIRLSFMMIPDVLDRETNLDLQQRDIVSTTIASVLDQARIALVEDLQGRRARTQGKAFMAEGYKPEAGGEHDASL